MLSTLQCGQIQHMPCTEKSLKYYVHNFDKVSSFLTQTVLILQYAKKIFKLAQLCNMVMRRLCKMRHLPAKTNKKLCRESCRLFPDVV